MRPVTPFMIMPSFVISKTILLAYEWPTPSVWLAASGNSSPRASRAPAKQGGLPCRVARPVRLLKLMRVDILSWEVSVECQRRRVGCERSSGCHSPLCKRRCLVRRRRTQRLHAAPRRHRGRREAGSIERHQGDSTVADREGRAVLMRFVQVGMRGEKSSLFVRAGALPCKSVDVVMPVALDVA